MKFLVIGDSCLDIYVYCTSGRFCPDAPVPVLNPVKTISSLGMAGNVVDNLKGLETEVDFITNKELIKKVRYVDDRTNHMFIRIDEGESNIERISKSTLENIKWENYEAVIVSDYCKGFLTEEDIEMPVLCPYLDIPLDYTNDSIQDNSPSRFVNDNLSIVSGISPSSD